MSAVNGNGHCSSEPPRDCEPPQQHGLMWKPSLQETIGESSSNKDASTVKAALSSAAATQPQPLVTDDIESAVAGLLGISHCDTAVDSNALAPPRTSSITAAIKPPAHRFQTDPLRVPSYAALTATTSANPPPTVRLVPSKPKRSMLAPPQLLMKKPKKIKLPPIAEVKKRPRGRPKKTGPPAKRDYSGAEDHAKRPTATQLQQSNPAPVSVEDSQTESMSSGQSSPEEPLKNQLEINMKPPGALPTVTSNSIAPPVQVVAETVTGRVVKKPVTFGEEIFGKNGRKPEQPVAKRPVKQVAVKHAVKPVAVKHPVKQHGAKQSETVVVKRGPGRPRKDEEEVVVVKRGPGRPRKNPEVVVAVKRGPGRPRKHAESAPTVKAAKPVAKAAPRAVVSAPTPKPAKPVDESLARRTNRRSFPPLPNGEKKKETVEDMFKAIVQATVKSTVPEEARRAAEATPTHNTRRSESPARSSRRGSGPARKETVEDMFKAIVQATKEQTSTDAPPRKPERARSLDGAERRPSISPGQTKRTKVVQPERKKTVEEMFKAIVNDTVVTTVSTVSGEKEEKPVETVKRKRGRPRKSEPTRKLEPPRKQSRERTPKRPRSLSPVLGLKPKEQATLPWKRSSKKPKLFTSEVFGKNGHPPELAELEARELELKKQERRRKRLDVPPEPATRALKTSVPPENTKPAEVVPESRPKQEATEWLEGKPELVQVGSRIQIYWEGDKKYFGGVVKRLRDHAKAFYVVYNDGDHEWINLGATKFRIARDNNSTGKKEVAGRKSEKLSKKEAPSNGKTATNGQGRKKKSYGPKIQKARRNARKRDGAAEVVPESPTADPEDNVYGLNVGCRVAVYWEGDRRYFNGNVTQKRLNHRKNFFVQYDDGDKEWIDFDDHKFRVFLEDGESTSEDTSHSDEEDSDEQRALAELGEIYERDTIANVKVGTRVAVYWDGDCEYFKARVTDKRSSNKKSFHLVYDDGQSEWIDLRRHVFVRLSDKRPRGRPRIYPRHKED